MKTIKIILSLTTMLFLTLLAKAQSEGGEELFKAHCSSCHSIGEGMRTGPDLINSTNRYTEKWLLKWIKSSYTMIQEGDKKAVALYDKYNQLSMPDQDLDDEQIKDILSFIRSESPSVEVADAGQIEVGKNTDDLKGEDKTKIVSQEQPSVLTVNTKRTSSKNKMKENSAAKTTVVVPVNNYNTPFFAAAGVVLFLLIILFFMVGIIKTLSAELSRTYKGLNNSSKMKADGL